MKLEEIRSLAQIMRDAELTSLEVSEGGLRVKLEKKQPVQPLAPAVFSVAPGAAASGAESTAAQPKPQETEQYREIKSPMVGVFYLAPSPESEPYVKVGSKVKMGDILCIIEAMKLMNEINSDQEGEIAEICVENGQVVEYGQTLFKLR